MMLQVTSIKRAIKLFTMAQCYTPAIQLAKVRLHQQHKHCCVVYYIQEQGFEGDVMGLALMGRQEDKIDAARY